LITDPGGFICSPKGCVHPRFREYSAKFFSPREKLSGKNKCQKTEGKILRPLSILQIYALTGDCSSLIFPKLQEKWVFPPKKRCVGLPTKRETTAPNLCPLKGEINPPLMGKPGGFPKGLNSQGTLDNLKKNFSPAKT